MITKCPMNWEVIQYLQDASVSYRIEVAEEQVFDQLLLSSLSGQSGNTQHLLSDVEEDKLRELLVKRLR